MGKRNASVVIVFGPHRTTLLLQRVPWSDESLRGWCPPGGHVDGGEEPLCAAERELFEETGLRVDINDLRPVGEVVSSRGICVHLFALEFPRLQPVYLSEEHDDYAWFTNQEIEKLEGNRSLAGKTYEFIQKAQEVIRCH